MSATPPTLGAEMLAALRHGFATVREGMTNPDIRIALKANAEMAKLVALCDRLGIEVPEEHAPIPSPASATQPGVTRQKKAQVYSSVFTSKSPDQIVPAPTAPQSLLGGMPLTSFLGSPKPTPPPIRSAASG